MDVVAACFSVPVFASDASAAVSGVCLDASAVYFVVVVVVVVVAVAVVVVVVVVAAAAVSYSDVSQ